ncbi:MAG: HAMP domain-containing histidine kinase [Cyclobacteriaceae bacterium]|nr:HAMP domain-containing histidine kinase [Cyclobacteriaceae bacterium]UYN86666.1 MAG: HAMP domain-containing histidine kinase [Cyclobacteriaceae bacterium]
MKKTIRNLIIGKNNYIESWTEYRQVILSGQFTLIAIILCTMYTLIDLSWGIYITIPVYSFCTAMLIIAIYQHRKGRHCSAYYIIFPTLNFIVYLFASSEAPATGAYILFLPIALGAFAVFNYKQRVIAVNLAALTYTLFVIAYFVDFSILPKRLYSDEELMANFMVNFAVALPTSILAIYLLISLNHHNGRELVNSNRMLKKLNEELDRFVYSTSHDLRAPLSSVTGLINLAKNNPNPNEVNRYLGMMAHRVDALDKFIKDITDYSRNNRMQITREQVNVHQLVQQIWESLMFSAEAQSIIFLNEIPQDLVIENDSKRLHMVMSNLIANAIRYHDNRKEKKYIRVYQHAIGTSFAIHVEDNGQGIAPEIQKKVFDMFYRGNETSQGSGLGLYIVKETITRLAGTVHLYSQPRVGSTFIVTLPVNG